jgi:hypothetical protein
LPHQAYLSAAVKAASRHPDLPEGHFNSFALPTPLKAFEDQRWCYFNLNFSGSQSKNTLSEKWLLGAKEAV